MTLKRNEMRSTMKNKKKSEEEREKDEKAVEMSKVTQTK